MWYQQLRRTLLVLAHLVHLTSTCPFLSTLLWSMRTDTLQCPQLNFVNALWHFQIPWQEQHLNRLVVASISCQVWHCGHCTCLRESERVHFRQGGGAVRVRVRVRRHLSQQLVLHRVVRTRGPLQGSSGSHSEILLLFSMAESLNIQLSKATTEFLEIIENQPIVFLLMNSELNWPDERTRLFNIIDGMLPNVLETYRDRNQRTYLTSRQKSSDFETIRSHLRDLKVSSNANPSCSAGPNPEHRSPEPSPSKVSRSKAQPTLTAQQRYSRLVLKEHPPSINYITSPEVREFLSAHINRLMNPLHDTIALKIKRDSQNASSNIDRAIGKYNVNKEFYHKLDEEDGVLKFSPEVQLLLDKKRAILMDSMRRIDTADFCSNQRLFRQRSALAFTKLDRGPPKADNDELKEQFATLVNYAKNEPVSRRGSQSVKRIRLPFSLDFKQFQKQAKTLEKLLKEKKPVLTKVNVHQRNLNKDEKRLRKLINLGDYVGYT